MQLDRVPPRIVPLSGTIPPPPGVEEPSRSWGDDSRIGVWARNPVRLRAWVLLVWLMVAVLGQGERFRLDPRFRTFDATLVTYWEALRANDAAAAWQCLAGGPYRMPYPGMLWFMPPTDELRITNLQALPVERDRMVVSYEVRYRPRGSHQELGFRTSSELIRRQGEWRIAHPIDAASVPEWRPTRGPVGC